MRVSGCMLIPIFSASIFTLWTILQCEFRYGQYRRELQDMCALAVPVALRNIRTHHDFADRSYLFEIVPFAIREIL